MILKPQDIVVMMKLVANGNAPWSYNRLAVALFMSPSEVHAAMKRAVKAQLATSLGDRLTPNLSNLKTFLLNGIRFVFIPDRGEMTRGIPTAYAAPPLSELIVASNEPPPVWPDPEGEVRGQSFSPLYKSVPPAAREDGRFYELMALVDSLRGGQAREIRVAVDEMTKRLDSYGNP